MPYMAIYGDIFIWLYNEAKHGRNFTSRMRSKKLTPRKESGLKRLERLRFRCDFGRYTFTNF